jgi:hypothetical protein
MGDGIAVALSVPPGDLVFLRSTLTMARDGVRDELARFAEHLREPTRLRREEITYGRLLVALGTRTIAVDHELRSVLGSLAAVIDATNDYDRVLAEHDALYALLVQVEGALS